MDDLDDVHNVHVFTDDYARQYATQWLGRLLMCDDLCRLFSVDNGGQCGRIKLSRLHISA